MFYRKGRVVEIFFLCSALTVCLPLASALGQTPTPTPIPHKAITSFKEAADLVAEKGEEKAMSVGFCTRFGINDCDRTPLHLRSFAANSDSTAKGIGTAKSSEGDLVMILRQDRNKARGEMYLCDMSGKLIRAYLIINNQTPTSMALADAKDGFAAEKAWWIDWLSKN